MKERISIAEIITNNFEDIKDNKYTWSQEELEALYKLIESRLIRFNINREYREDLNGEIVLKIFSYVINKIDISIPEAISTYLVASIDNEIRDYIKNNTQNCKNYSLDETAFKEYVGRSDKPLLNVDLLKDESDLRCCKEVLEYEEELTEIVKHFDCVKLSYIDKLEHRKIAELYNISRSNATQRIRWQLDSVKIILMMKGYTSDFFSKYMGYNVFSDEYKYCESLIEKYGLLYLIYNKKTNNKDIAEALGIASQSVVYALNYLNDRKVEILESKNVSNARRYIDFTSCFLPELLYNIETQDKGYFELIDNIIDNNEYTKMRFIEQKSIKEIAQVKSKSIQNVFNYFNRFQKTVAQSYEVYKKSKSRKR